MPVDQDVEYRVLFIDVFGFLVMANYCGGVRGDFASPSGSCCAKFGGIDYIG
jgi:hypothetical protein